MSLDQVIFNILNNFFNNLFRFYYKFIVILNISQYCHKFNYDNNTIIFQQEMIIFVQGVGFISGYGRIRSHHFEHHQHSWAKQCRNICMHKQKRHQDVNGRIQWFRTSKRSIFFFNCLFVADPTKWMEHTHISGYETLWIKTWFTTLT